MSSEAAGYADDQVEWSSFTSDNGAQYEVGIPKGVSHTIAADADSSVQGKVAFGIGVNWPLGDSEWKPVAPEVYVRASISRYSLCEWTGLYDYKLYFTNIQHYNYYFYDETGDGYKVNTFRNGDHFVRYNSKMPKIVFIKGS